MKHDNIKSSIINAWKIAESDLKIEIESPFILEESKGNFVEFDMLVKNFGSAYGTVISLNENTSNFEFAKSNGYYCSALNPNSYSDYNRTTFIETLNDWGFYGDEKQIPDWYSGASW